MGRVRVRLERAGRGWARVAGAGVAGARAADLDAFRNELLVWAPGGFSEREVGRVRDSTRVAAISAVRTGTLPAASGRRGGYRVVPVETMAVDTNAYTAAAGKPGRKLATLLPKGAVLSKTGAKLRRVKSGGKLRLTGNRTVAVSGVVDDALLGGYEVALERTLARRYGIQRAAYLLVRPRGPVDGLQAELRKLLKGRSVRFVTPATGRTSGAATASCPWPRSRPASASSPCPACTGAGPTRPGRGPTW